MKACQLSIDGLIKLMRTCNTLTRNSLAVPFKMMRTTLMKTLRAGIRANNLKPFLTNKMYRKKANSQLFLFNHQ